MATEGHRRYGRVSRNRCTLHSQRLILTFCLDRCVLSALLGMVAIAWYTSGGQLSDDEIEHQVRSDMAEKKKRTEFLKKIVPGRS
jgi:uncharacterized Fe-S cluster-containing MiaB family protein